ncbi:MAG: hypothetical protein K2G70_04450 [Turicibacter sp.]|nr:hypothetical protein [Turicibacter sp.]
MVNVTSPSNTRYYISHSAKGSTWEKHKYVKVLNGIYYYPNTYEKGRKIESLIKKSKLTGTGTLTDARTEKKSTTEDKTSSTSTSDADKKKKRKKINKLAKAVISGKYGVGQERMDKLGKKYSKVQNRVNQILLGKDAAKRIADRKKAASSGTANLTTKKTATKQKKVTSRKK